MKNTEINKGVIIQETQQSQSPVILPQKSINMDQFSVGTRRLLQNANVVVGSVSEVADLAADFSLIQDAINYLSGIGGGKIFVLNGAYTENLTIPSDIMIEGQGHKTSNTGTILFTGNGSMVKYIRNIGDVTFDTSTDYNRFTDCWIGPINVVINNGLLGNAYEVSGE